MEVKTMTATRSQIPGLDGHGLVIRPLHGDDLTAAQRLAQLDSSPLPEGDLLGALVEGRLLAAISVASGESIADPFSRTADLRALLELRAAQLRRRVNGRRRLRRRLPRPKPRAALAGSPPGAERWLMARRWRPL
jgi:hypothetical protein